MIHKNWCTIIFCIALGVALAASGGLNQAEAEESQNSQYTIRVKDKLGVSVWNQEDLSKEVVVRPDGQINLPLVGEVQAKGLTVSELNANLNTLFDKYVPGSPVTVEILDTPSRRVFVVGKVENPGAYEMIDDISVMQLLALAGGLNRFANEKDIIIIRKVGAKQKSIPFDYNKVATGKNIDQNIILQAGDTVVVP